MGSTIEQKKVRVDRVLPLWIVALVFALTTVIFFKSQLVGDTFFWEDFVEYVYPTQTYAANAFSNGEIPVWNPYVFGGMPFIADLQVGFFYPFNRLLSLGLDDNGVLSPGFLEFIVILHFFLAQLGMYLLCRYFKISSYSSLIPAVSFSFSSAFVMHAIHPMIIYHLTWLPWVVWMFKKGIDLGSLKYASIGGLILGMSFLAGHPQTALYELFFLFLFMIWVILRDKGKEVPEKANNNKVMRWIAPLTTFILAAGVFSIQLLPTQELAESAKRAEATYEYVTEGSMDNGDLAKMILPEIKGRINWEDNTEYYYETENGQPKTYFYWEKALYVGLVALVLGITAFILMPKHTIVGFLLIFSFLGILFSYGSNGFVFDIFYNLPFFDTFRFPIRMMYLVMFCITLASGFAMDKLKNVTGQGTKREIVVVNSVLAFVGIIAMLVWSGSFNNALAVPSEMIETLQTNAANALISILILGFALAALYFHKVRNGIAISVVFLFAFIDLYMHGAAFNANPNNGYQKYELNPQFAGAFSIKPPNEVFRVNSRMYNPPAMTMQRNQGLVNEIMLIEGYNPLLLNRIMPLFPEPSDVHGALNVKYELGLDKATSRPRFYERRDDIAPAWIVRNVKASSSKEETESKMQNLPKDSFREIAVIEPDQSSIPSLNFEASTSDDKVKVTEYRNDYISYDVETNSEGLMVFSEIYYPAWNTYINGEEVDMFIADGSLRSAIIPSGKSKVELVFESSALSLGTIISIISIIAGSFLIVWFRKE